ERAPELREHVGDLRERHGLEVGERHRARERQLVDVLARVGRRERARARASAELDPVTLDQLAADEQRNAERAHPSIPCMKRSASDFTSSVAEQLIRSSSTPFFSL